MAPPLPLATGAGARRGARHASRFAVGSERGAIVRSFGSTPLAADLPDDIARWLEARSIPVSERLAALFHALYADLRRRAHFVRGDAGGGVTLDTTELVSETYLRLSGARDLPVESRGHFLALAARTMRWVLTDRARARQQLRRGGGEAPLTLEESHLPPATRDEELLALDAALEALGIVDRRLADVVEYRFFGGFDVEDTARLLGVSTRTVKRDWHAARAFLARALEAGGASP